MEHLGQIQWKYSDRPAASAVMLSLRHGFTAPNPANRLGNSTRNSLIGPGLVNLDFSLFKNIPMTKISESFKVQFRMEFFNVLNHPSFKSPTNNLTILNPDGSTVPFAGALTLTSTTSRQIQFALKLSW
jgi:hypothetical protein